jgi:prolyl oligopeptidase
MSAPILRGSVFLFSLLFSSIGVAEEPASDGAASALVYPEARMGTVVDTYHGVEVPDPYRWMEDPDGVETREWVEAQVDVTTEWLEAVPRRSVLAERLTKLWNYERYSSPSRK